MQKLLYVSPFRPQKSGISDYSERLVWGLKDDYEVTLLTKYKKIDNNQLNNHFKVLTYSKSNDYSQYDVIIYNFGNSPENHDYMCEMLRDYPGYVILHDFSLYYLACDYYEKNNKKYSSIYQLEGKEKFLRLKEKVKSTGESNLLMHKDLAADFPLNFDLLESAKGFFVHSEYTKKKVQEVFPEKNIWKINIVDCMPELTLSDGDFLRDKYGWASQEYIVGAVGMIAPSKQNREAIEAINSFNDLNDKKIKYVMIGEGEYVDSYLGENIKKTGYMEDQDFYDAINSCDAIFNLRYPYNGESSASLMQCMLMGKDCVVTDLGWFGELPDNVVFKVPDNSKDSILKVIERLLNQETKSSEAKKFVEEKCNSEVICKNIIKAITDDMEEK